MHYLIQQSVCLCPTEGMNKKYAWQAYEMVSKLMWEGGKRCHWEVHTIHFWCRRMAWNVYLKLLSALLNGFKYNGQHWWYLSSEVAKGVFLGKILILVIFFRQRSCYFSVYLEVWQHVFPYYQLLFYKYLNSQSIIWYSVFPTMKNDNVAPETVLHVHVALRFSIVVSLFAVILRT